MRVENEELRARLERYELDREGAFSARLARENRWTPSYARRVCEEYKRFAFVAATAGRPCTPSDAVDQAWHLHILQGSAYAQAFCAEVLGTALVHEPSRGGAAERAKFERWYAHTLERYRACFGCDAPSDIWPPPARRFAARYVRVDAARHIILPKPQLGLARFPRRGSLRALALGGAALIALAGCSFIHEVPPFQLEGGPFLALFASVWLASVLAIAVMRRRLSARRLAAVPALDAYELAYLAGGHKLAARSIGTALLERGELIADARNARLRAMDDGTYPAHPTERAFLASCGRLAAGSRLDQLEKLTEQHAPALRERLDEAGLLLTRREIRMGVCIALIAPALGVIKLGVGIAHDKPIGFLLVLCAGATAWALYLGRSGQRTAKGNALLARLREEHDPTRSKPDGAHGSTLTLELAVALFGVSVLSGTALAHAMPLLAPPVTPWSSSVGAGGDPGSDGGCGGGGCGGCGGCGG